MLLPINSSNRYVRMILGPSPLADMNNAGILAAEAGLFAQAIRQSLRAAGLTDSLH